MVCTTGFGFSLAVDCMVKLCEKLTGAVASGDHDHGESVGKCACVLCVKLTIDGCECTLFDHKVTTATSSQQVRVV